MKLTGKAPKKSPKKSPAALPKLAIVDACAAYLCEQPPAKGSSYCAEHKAPSAKEAATQQLLAAGLGKKRAKPGAPKKAAAGEMPDEVRAQLAQLIAGTPSLKAEAKKAKPAEPSKADEKAQRSEAAAIIGQLRAKGWSDGKIGAAMGVNPSSLRSTVWGWRMKKTTCRDMGALNALMQLDAPLEVAKKKPAAKKAKNPEVQGVIRMSHTVAAKKATPYGDPNQLVLQLTSIRDAISDLLAAK